MTFEEAKQIFLNRGYEQVDGGSIYNADKWRDSVIVISNWLQQEPVDAVSRADAIKAVTTMCEEYTSTKSTYHPHIDFVVEELNKLPSVQPKLKTGRWEFVHPLQEDDGGAYMCSECKVGYLENPGDWRYCPNCGAKMEVEK